MGTLRQVKKWLKEDAAFRKALVRSAKDEILIDVDHDGAPDIALMDSTGDGYVDTLAIELTGNDEFDLYFHMMEGSDSPALLLLDSDGENCADSLGFSKELGLQMIDVAQSIFSLTYSDHYDAETFERRLDELQSHLEKARTEYQA